MPDTDAGVVVYARKAVSARGWAVPFVLVGLLTLGFVVADLPHVNATTVLAPVGASSPVLLIWLLTLWSLDRYGAVTLTRETLRVGRDRVPVADIEPHWVRTLATKADPALAQRLGTSASTVQVPGSKQADRDRGRLLGGAYAATFGDDLVTLELRGNERVTVPTRDRRGLLAGLLTALDETGGA